MEKWVKALESGRYKQGKKRLKTRTGNYCCLGVLCAISRLGKFNKKGLFKISGDQIEEEVPPLAVKNWAGLKTFNGELGGGLISLTQLNDKGNQSFKEIAAIIKKKYRSL